MKNIIYHNPNWSKSRKSVEILEKSGIEFEVIQYIKQAPSVNQIKDICNKLNLKPKQIIRKEEKDFKENNLAQIIENEEILLQKKYFKLLTALLSQIMMQKTEQILMKSNML